MDQFIAFFNNKESNQTIKARLDIQDVKEHADKLLNNTFSFNRPWDMEPCLTDYTNTDLNWEWAANQDEEWTFMLNRFDYLKSLVLMFVKTEEPKYKDKVIDLITDWIQAHPTVVPQNSTRTLDTAIRIDTWVHALKIISNETQLEPEFLHMVKTSIEMQIDYMKKHFITKYLLSNWGSIQTSVILRMMPLLDTNYQENQTFIWARETFETQIRLQIYPDGLLWEQSTMYHVEVLKNFVKVNTEHSITNLKETLIKMTQGLIHLSNPKGQTETFGDSDRSAILDICSYVSVSVKDSSLKLKDDTINDSERLYEMSDQAIRDYEDMKSNFNLSTTFDAFDSGIHTLRSAWTKEANYTLFTNGSLGSGHGHADNLHLSIYHQGEPILIDSGRYTYREDLQERLDLKAMNAHNVVTIAGRTLSSPDSSWTFDHFVNVKKNYANHQESFHYLEGAISDTNYLNTRKVLMSDNDVWLIVDDIESEGHITGELNFNIDHEVDIQQKKNEIQVNKLKLNVINSKPVQIENSIQSVQYNELNNNKRLVFPFEARDRIQLITIICPKDTIITEVEITQGDAKVVDKNQGIAYRFNEAFTLIVMHNETYKGTKILKCEGQYFHGKVMVYDHRTNKMHLMRA